MSIYMYVCIPLTTEPLQSEDRRQSPDLQVVEAPVGDDPPTTHAGTLQQRHTIKQVCKARVEAFSKGGRLYVCVCVCGQEKTITLCMLYQP